MDPERELHSVKGEEKNCVDKQCGPPSGSTSVTTSIKNITFESSSNACSIKTASECMGSQGRAIDDDSMDHYYLQLNLISKMKTSGTLYHHSDSTDSNSFSWKSDSLSSEDCYTSSDTRDEGGGKQNPTPKCIKLTSIQKIRQEASRMNTVLAMDQLDSLKLELDETKKQLLNKKFELAEHKSVIKLKDNRLATLELERDLYKADAAAAATKTRWNSHQRCRRSETFNNAHANAKDGDDSSKLSVTEVRFTNLPDFSDPKKLECKSGDSCSSVDSATTVNHGVRLHDSNLNRTNDVIRGAKRLASMIVKKKEKSRDTTRNLQSPKSISSLKSSSPPSFAHAHSHHYQQHTPLPPNVWSFHSMNDTSRNDWRARTTPCHTDSLEEQMNELQGRLESSIKAASELRTRLAMINCFYERTLRTINVRYNATRLDQVSMKQDYLYQLQSVEASQKRVIEALETKLTFCRLS